MKICHISDTHGKHNSIPWNFDPANLDMIIHSGDISMIGEKKEVESFFNWFSNLPIKYKIVVPGNHDKCFDKKFWGYSTTLVEKDTKKIIKKFKSNKNHFFLNRKAVEIEGIHIYGCPYSNWFHGERWAFNVHPGPDSKKLYNKIPKNTDILITHGPPLGIMDYTYSHQYVGSPELVVKVKKIKPKYHLFGHIHECYGEYFDGTTTFLNSSILNLSYEPVNLPQIFVL